MQYEEYNKILFVDPDFLPLDENFYKVSPGALSRWILWSSTSLVHGIKNFKKNVGC